MIALCNNQVFDIFLIIKAATNASRRLRGTAPYKIPRGNTPRFAATTHINTNPTNHARNVVCASENFFARIKIAMANKSDHTPHKAPLMGLEGNVRPRLS